MSTGSNSNIVDTAELAEQSDLLEIPEIPRFLRRERKMSSPKICAQTVTGAETDLADALPGPVAVPSGAVAAAISPLMSIDGEHASQPVSDNAASETNVAVDAPDVGLHEAKVQEPGCGEVQPRDPINPTSEADRALAPPEFDYASLDRATANDLRAVAARVRSFGKKMAAAMIEVGRDLISAKNKLKHGQFGDWLSTEFSMTERTARRYMSAAANFGDKTDLVSDLQPSMLHLLASPSTPVAVREDVLDRIKTGASISEESVKFAIAEAKYENRKARAKEHRSKRRSESKKRQAERQAAEERRKEDRRQAERAVGDMADLLRRHFGQEQIKTLLELAEIVERELFNLHALWRLLREERPDG